MHTPQILIIILFTIRVTYAACCNGESRKIVGWATFINVVLLTALLYWGGFFG